MDQQKQIREISEILTDAAHKTCSEVAFEPRTIDCSSCPPTECQFCLGARALVAQGYCQQSETIRKMQARFNQIFGGADSTSILLRQTFEQIAKEILEVKE